STLPGNRVRIMGHGGDVLGVIGRTPTHILKEEERKKAPELRGMWIDIGASSRSEAEARVGVGDAGGRAGAVERLQGNIVAANSLDDRMGAYIVAEVFRNLAAAPPAAAVFASSCVQEEIGLRGAGATTYGINPDIGIAIDVTWTTDHPNVSVTEFGTQTVGKGPLIARGAANNPKVVDLLVRAAQAEGVPYQIEADATGRGTDEFVMQTTRAGIATGLVSIPTRYLHTSSEVLSTDDIDAAVALITRFVKDLPNNPDLIP
ncbi:MAG TPA: M42 family peptidase, partial [Chloroflexota bacterium]|nr:M42 family peptidase [Chloroflexota bacterium]